MERLNQLLGEIIELKVGLIEFSLSTCSNDLTYHSGLVFKIIYLDAESELEQEISQNSAARKKVDH